MQNKGIIRFFAIIFALVCLFQLSFTVVSTLADRKMKEYANDVQALDAAKELANGDIGRESFIRDSISKARERFYFDSIENENIYNLLWLRKYTFKEVKERELNLGLDLRGGMNVIMEVSVVDVIRSLSGYSPDTTFNKAIDLALQRQKSSNEDFVALFGKAFQEIAPNASLASIFSTIELKDKIPFNATNEEVLKVIRTESNGAIATSYNILRSRIDRFGVAQPNIQELQTKGRILIELPGVKDPERVRKLLQGTARLEFWETYSFADPEILNAFEEANKRLRDMQALQEETKPAEETTPAEKPKQQPDNEAATALEMAASADTSLLADGSEASILEQAVDSAEQKKSEYTFEQYAKENPLYAYLQPSTYRNEQGQTMVYPSATIGHAHIKDTARINSMLKSVSNLFPRNLKMMWTVKPDKKGTNVLNLVAIKTTTRDGSPRLTGEVVTNARQDVDHVTGSPNVSMSMNTEGARIWKQMTHDNIGKQVAIVLDGHVYSYPNVNTEIAGGQSSISGGSMTIEEAQDLANILKAGKLPAPARIIQEAVVGPSLGQAAISAGMWSFLLAFIMVLVYMIFFYDRAGWTACVALIVNLFFIFGVLTSFGAALTLPGIAGIVLTLAMAIDTNVIIYERVREELRAGKGLRLAIQDGYKNAYSAIIDITITTLLTAIVLFVFNSGPVQGFATTLIIGTLTSFFTSIFITRLMFEARLNRNKAITFDSKITRTWFSNNQFHFIKNRKITYVISASLIAISLISLVALGLNYGIDFKGGRSYVVRFDQPVSVPDIRSALGEAFEKNPEVKTFGPNTQVKITTDYKYDDNNVDVDKEVEAKLYTALKPFYKEVDISQKDFLTESSNVENKYLGILSSEKVGATIAYDIKFNAALAIFFALLIMFGYIALRFKKWQYGLAGVITLAHDALVTIGMFSLLYSILPFNLEVDQAFIAAILTVIGYSINGVVIIFDRVRENVYEHSKRTLFTNMNNAINSTLGRTINTSGSTILILLMIFLFGGESIRGFIFAMLVGIAAGTYSSIFNAASLAYDMIIGKKGEEEIVEKGKK